MISVAAVAAVEAVVVVAVVDADLQRCVLSACFVCLLYISVAILTVLLSINSLKF